MFYDIVLGSQINLQKVTAKKLIEVQDIGLSIALGLNLMHSLLLIKTGNSQQTIIVIESSKHQEIGQSSGIRKMLKKRMCNWKGKGCVQFFYLTATIQKGKLWSWEG